MSDVIDYGEAAKRHDAKQDADEKAKVSAATTLVGMATERYKFGISTLGEPYAIPKKGPQVVSMLRGSKTALRNQLSRAYFSVHQKAAPQQALADALLVIEGMCQEEEPEELHQRVARYRNEIWLDLGDNTGRAVRITPSGWSVENDPPVLFKRTVLTSALPDPSDGRHSLDELWTWLNVSEPDRPLLIGWLIASLFPSIPHPILSLHGEQGTGKTTVLKAITSIIDPSAVPTRKSPRDAEAWVTAAAGSWVVGIDNVSYVQDWFSDSLCRAVSGDGDVRRMLYRDSDLAVFAFRRCIILSAIDLGALRGDLAERLLPIGLSTIDDAHRAKDEAIWKAWDKVHPRVLGALLDLAVATLKVLPTVELPTLPRMADFAEIQKAVDIVLGTDGLSRYLDLAGAIARDSLASDPFIVALEDLGEFRGTASELYEKLTPERPPKGWPSNARAVSQALRRHAPALRRSGWTVDDDGGRNHQKALCWTLIPPSHPEKARNSHPQPPQDPQTAQRRGLERGHERGGAEDTSPHTRNDTREAEPLETAPYNGFSGSAGVAGVAGVDCTPSQDELDEYEQAYREEL